VAGIEAGVTAPTMGEGVQASPEDEVLTTMDARKPRVRCGFMSGRLRQPPSGATSRRSISSSSTCGGGSTETCMARHKATRTEVSRVN